MIEFKTAPNGYRVFVKDSEVGFYTFSGKVFSLVNGKLEFAGAMPKEQAIEYFSEIESEIEDD